MEEKIKEIISEYLSVYVNEIHDNTHIIADLNADSLDIMEIVMELEEEFFIVIYDNEVKKLTDFSSIKKLVSEKIN